MTGHLRRSRGHSPQHRTQDGLETGGGPRWRPRPPPRAAAPRPLPCRAKHHAACQLPRWDACPVSVIHTRPLDRTGNGEDRSRVLMGRHSSAESAWEARTRTVGRPALASRWALRSRTRGRVSTAHGLDPRPANGVGVFGAEAREETRCRRPRGDQRHFGSVGGGGTAVADLAEARAGGSHGDRGRGLAIDHRLRGAARRRDAERCG